MDELVNSILVGLACAVILLIWRFRAQNISGLPGPRGLPLIGSLLDLWKALARDEWHHWVLSLGEKYTTKSQTCFSVAIPTMNILAVTSPECVKHVLKTNFNNYEKTVLNDRFRELLGHGIFNSDGDTWRFQRKAASHMFSLRQLRDNMTPVFVSHSRIFVQELQQAAQSGQQVDLQRLFFCFTFDSICEIAFGEHISSLSAEPNGKEAEFQRAFDAAQQFCFLRLLNPAWRVMKLLRFPQYREFLRNIATIDKTAYAVLQRRKTEGLESRTDLLSQFLLSAQREGRSMPDEVYRNVITNFMVAGRDTTACLLTWLFFELDKPENKEVRARVVEEVDATLQDPLNPTYHECSQMTYLDACLFETLRLYPSVPHDMKTSVGSDTLPDGTKVPPDTQILYSPFIMGRSERIWPKPTEFQPQRWLGEKRPDEYIFPSFNAGKRLCLGKAVAILEAKICASMILSKFSVQCVNRQDDVVKNMSITLSIKDGLHVKLTPREPREL